MYDTGVFLGELPQTPVPRDCFRLTKSEQAAAGRGNPNVPRTWRQEKVRGLDTVTAEIFILIKIFKLIPGNLIYVC